MHESLLAVQDFWRQWTSAESLMQLVAIAAAIALALVLGHWLRRACRRWCARRRGGGITLLRATAVIAPYLIAAALLAIAREWLASAGQPTQRIDTALPLTLALAAVRFGVHLLRGMLGAGSWVARWEKRLTLIVWLAIAFQLIGWFGGIERALDSVDILPGKAEFTLWSLIKGIVVVTGFVVVTSIVARAIEARVMTLDNVALSTRIGISKFSHFLLVSLGVLIGINASGVDLTALTVLTGGIGLGLGFGLQSIAANFVSGFVLLLDKSIKPGDVISFTGHTGTSTENFGWVEELRGRYVVVRDRDGVETLVPNQNLITNSVINWSYSDKRVRIKLPVRISYRDDPEQALELLLRATDGHARVLHEPAPVSRLMQFSESGMDLELRFWIADPESGVNNVRSDVNRAIWRLFRSAGITIPVAQREIHVHGSAPLP